MALGLFQKHTLKFVTVLLTLSAGLVLSAARKSYFDVCRANGLSPCSVLEGRTIRLVPLGARFDVPQAWLDWQAQFHNNFHLTRWQLYDVMTAFGEWDSEYAQVTNAVLPFENCAVHAGGEGWGLNGVSFGDPQLRVYVGNWVPEDLKKRIATAGLTQAGRVAKRARVSSEMYGAWQRDTLTYEVFYYDYGGTAKVDFFTRVRAGNTVVFVFMYAKDSEDIHKILDSFT